MDVSDAELREMIRDVIAARASQGSKKSGGGAAQQPPLVSASPAHASHERLALTRGGDGDGACLIEPAVRCNHCGFCLSFGH
jgi:hypothetical protein